MTFEVVENERMLLKYLKKEVLRLEEDNKKLFNKVSFLNSIKNCYQECGKHAQDLALQHIEFIDKLFSESPRERRYCIFKDRLISIKLNNWYCREKWSDCESFQLYVGKYLYDSNAPFFELDFYCESEFGYLNHKKTMFEIVRYLYGLNDDCEYSQQIIDGLLSQADYGE